MKKIMFCGGGSAGHVVPNLALCEQLKGKYNICYIGTRAIERELCKSNSIEFFCFDGVKLVRDRVLCNLSIPHKLHTSIVQCGKILEREKPDLLFCKGGYVSLPPAIAAHKLGITILTHESDIKAGLANKLIARRCRKVLTAFPSTAAKFKNGVYTGTPLRKNLFGRDKFKEKSRLGCDLRPAILVLGGGSGSTAINECLRGCLTELCKDYNIIHVCGRGNAVRSTLSGYRQIEFCDDMGQLYACADYAVSRSGSNAANELIALKIPTLFIPLENAASRGDQIDNAMYFYGRGLCRILRQSQMTPSSLKQAIGELLADDKLISSLKNNNFKRGNERIIAEIESALN